jgi:hypothetical protein
MNLIKTAIQRATNRIDIAEHADVQRASMSVEEVRADLIREWSGQIAGASGESYTAELWAARRMALHRWEMFAKLSLQSLVNRESEEVGAALLDLASRHQEYLAQELHAAVNGIDAKASVIGQDERERLMGIQIEGKTFSEYLRDTSQEALRQMSVDLARLINASSSLTDMIRNGGDHVTATMKGLRESFGKTVGSFAALIYRDNAESVIQAIRDAA